MPLGMEVDLRTDHIVLDGFPALRERGTALLPSFRPCLLDCGHGRPSQLLLSSCIAFYAFYAAVSVVLYII